MDAKLYHRWREVGRITGNSEIGYTVDIPGVLKPPEPPGPDLITVFFDATYVDPREIEPMFDNLTEVRNFLRAVGLRTNIPEV